jgi:hypothetical protein
MRFVFIKVACRRRRNKSYDFLVNIIGSKRSFKEGRIQELYHA